MRRLRSASSRSTLAAAIAAALLAGCGSSAAPRTERAAQAGFRSYLAAVSAAHFATACQDSTSASQVRLVRAAAKLAKHLHDPLPTGTKCELAMRFIVDNTPPTARIEGGFRDDITFTGGRLSGDSASVDFRIKGDDGQGTGTMRLASGRWLTQSYTVSIFSAYLGSAPPTH